MTGFDHALDSALLDRFERDGPIDVAVTYSEYRGHLLPLAQRSWRNPTLWDRRECQRMLLFFRGYSFFRQLGENEREFWSNLHTELGYLHSVTNAHRDMLERALKSDERIRGMFLQDARREFVKSIDAIWGIRSLNAQSLEKLFRRYYFQTKSLDVSADLIRELLRGEPSEKVERAARQSASYDRIFRGLRDAIEFIGRNSIDTGDFETLRDRMQERGYVFGEPNPVEFFRNKAERALRNLLQQLRGEMRVAHRPPLRVTAPSPLEEAPPESGLTRERTVRVRENFAVNVQYADSTYEFAEAIRLEFSHLPLGSRVLRLSGDTERDIPFTGAALSFIIAPGTTRAQVFVEGEPVTRPKTLFGLPPLKWRFYDQRGERMSERPIEGRSLTAEVHLEDGTFERVRWRAAWDSAGRVPLAYPVQLEPGGFRIEAQLSAEAHAVRFLGAGGEVLDALTTQAGVYLHALPKSTTAAQKIGFAYGHGNAVDVDDDDFAGTLASLRSEVDDELIVERNINGNFEAVGRISTRLPPIWHDCQLQGTNLEVYATAPLGAIWRVREAHGVEHEYAVTDEPQTIALRDQRRAFKREISVNLECGEYSLERRVTYQPNWTALLEAELSYGLGWGRLG